MIIKQYEHKPFMNYWSHVHAVALFETNNVFLTSEKHCKPAGRLPTSPPNSSPWSFPVNPTSRQNTFSSGLTRLCVPHMALTDIQHYKYVAFMKQYKWVSFYALFITQQPHLICVHVGLRTRSSLPYHKRKMITIQLPTDNIISSFWNSFSNLWIQTVIFIDDGSCFLQNSHRSDYWKLQKITTSVHFPFFFFFKS